jgi:hypothetical protein
MIVNSSPLTVNSPPLTVNSGKAELRDELGVKALAQRRALSEAIAALKQLPLY